MKTKKEDTKTKQSKSSVITVGRKKISKIGQFLASGEKTGEIIDMRAVLR